MTLAGPGCIVKLGFAPLSEDFKKMIYSAGRWVKTQEDADNFLKEERCMPAKKYKAVILSPLALGRPDPPDIVFNYGTPAQMIMIHDEGLQWENYKPIKGESGEGVRAFIEMIITW